MKWMQALVQASASQSPRRMKVYLLETVDVAQEIAVRTGFIGTKTVAVIVPCLMPNDAKPSVPPCPCECNRGGFCGGCGHAGCGGRR